MALCEFQSLKMFVVSYEFEIKSGMKKEFSSAWLEFTKSIYKHCGSLGSRLHRSEHENIMIGYAQWPSREQWEKDIQVTDSCYHSSREAMRKCLIQLQVVHKLEVSNDYLQPALASA